MTTFVPSGGDLQAAINAAQPNDIIELPAGTHFTGTFTLGVKSGLVTLRTAGTLPNRRIHPLDAPLLATLVSPGNGAPAIDGTNAKHWKVDGITFSPDLLGFGETIRLSNAQHVTLDRILLVVPYGQELKRGISANGQSLTITRSHLEGIWRTGQDSQGIAILTGKGPYTITDNFIEAASENLLIG